MTIETEDQPQLTVRTPEEVNFSAEEAAAYEPIGRHVDKIDSSQLADWYELGRLLAEAIRGLLGAAKRRRRGQPGDGRAYALKGEQFLKKAAAKANYSVAPFQNALRVYDTWPKQRQFDAYVDMRSEDGTRRLYWSHLVELASFDNEADRVAVARKVLEEGLTSDDVARLRRQAAADPTAKGPGGRPPKAPRSFPDAMNRISEWATQSSNLFDVAILGERYDIRREFASIPESSYDARTLAQIEVTKAKAFAAAAKAKAAAETLAEFELKVRGVLDRKAAG
jgi:hypothetical protein